MSYDFDILTSKSIGGILGTNKGRDLQQDSIAASKAKHQNTQSENTDTTYTARDAKVTRDIKYDIKTLNTKDYT